MTKRQYVYISVVSTSGKNEFVKSLAYGYDKELNVCIAKDETKQYPYSWTDIDTGCTFGRRFKTIKEAQAIKDQECFSDWMKKVIHMRRMSSSYHELKVCKQIFMNHWRVVDEF